jgi:hypothetical protein
MSTRKPGIDCWFPFLPPGFPNWPPQYFAPWEPGRRKQTAASCLAAVLQVPQVSGITF